MTIGRQIEQTFVDSMNDLGEWGSPDGIVEEIAVILRRHGYTRQYDKQWRILATVTQTNYIVTAASRKEAYQKLSDGIYDSEETMETTNIEPYSIEEF